ncbi:hypothetical protein, partial [Bradyrhizobium liaoningense]|uniref:hypothetical protein n=1 Tax=Bradyrhizobium liaoningense TaxID=43992 RepID=UPI0024E0F479
MLRIRSEDDEEEPPDAFSGIQGEGCFGCVWIPTKPAMHSNSKPAGYSDLKPATRGVVRMGQFHDV